MGHRPLSGNSLFQLGCPWCYGAGQNRIDRYIPLVTSVLTGGLTILSMLIKICLFFRFVLLN